MEDSELLWFEILGVGYDGPAIVVVASLLDGDGCIPVSFQLTAVQSGLPQVGEWITYHHDTESSGLDLFIN